MTISRRDFIIGGSSAVILGLIGLRSALAGNILGDVPLLRGESPYLALPKRFSYQVISKLGDKMADGLVVPGKPDSMAAFRMAGGLTAIVRNHEIEAAWTDQSPFSAGGKKTAGYDASCIGGCSTIIYDTKTQKLVRQFLSLSGTERNCSGGATPWGTWISSEESTKSYEKTHGYNFEVKPSLQPQLSDPLPLKAMGRFNHESVSFDPATGIAYQTEDRGDGLFYRFIPTVRGNLSMGGKLQALMIRNLASYDTRNWDEERITQGERMPCQWVDLYDVESPKDDLRLQGFAAGAARFARGEGTCYANGSIYFTATNGGIKKQGQVWKYTPNKNDGTLELFVDANDPEVMKSPDNLCLGPRGDLFICEDSKKSNRILRVNAKGEVSVFAENIFNESELTGVCFSPDGSTMFVNIQHNPGMTFAITGPWLA